MKFKIYLKSQHDGLPDEWRGRPPSLLPWGLPEEGTGRSSSGQVPQAGSLHVIPRPDAQTRGGIAWTRKAGADGP